MPTAANCQTCGWTIREEDMTTEDIEFAGAGGLGIWQFAVFHVHAYDDGSPESIHEVIQSGNCQKMILFYLRNRLRLSRVFWICLMGQQAGWLLIWGLVYD